MTEEEWFAGANPEVALQWLGGRAGERKLRLFGCACLRLLGDLLPWKLQECVKYTEKFADGLLRPHEFESRIIARTAPLDMRTWEGWLARNDPVRPQDLNYLTAPAAEFAQQAARHCSSLLDRIQTNPDLKSPGLATSGLLRDIVGNPFRPATFDPAWRTSTAVALAKQMYVSRDFAIMPILGDALQDAGCDNDDILAHCRDPQAAHVRGCWVVDLVLGKS